MSTGRYPFKDSVNITIVHHNSRPCVDQCKAFLCVKKQYRYFMRERPLDAANRLTEYWTQTRDILGFVHTDCMNTQFKANLEIAFLHD